jgi:Pyruvate phosphate dikinase, AMP/ATP-binding domain
MVPTGRFGIPSAPLASRMLECPREGEVMETESYVSDITSLRITDAEDAGGKGANLGELVAAELPVPGGFVLMRSGYLDSMQAGGVEAELPRPASKTLSATRSWPPIGGWAPMSLLRCGRRPPARTAAMRLSPG